MWKNWNFDLNMIFINVIFVHNKKLNRKSSNSKNVLSANIYPFFLWTWFYKFSFVKTFRCWDIWNSTNSRLNFINQRFINKALRKKISTKFYCLLLLFKILFILFILFSVTWKIKIIICWKNCALFEINTISSQPGVSQYLFYPLKRSDSMVWIFS